MRVNWSKHSWILKKKENFEGGRVISRHEFQPLGASDKGKKFLYMNIFKIIIWLIIKNSLKEDFRSLICKFLYVSTLQNADPIP